MRVDPGAQGMDAEIVRAGLAAAGAVKRGQRFRAAFGERVAKDIARTGGPGVGNGRIRQWNPPWLSRAAGAARGEARLDRVPDIYREIDPVEPSDLLDAGRRGHVDLGHVVADHVDPDKNQPLRPEARPDRGANLALARRQPRLLRAAADMQIGRAVSRARRLVV